MLSHTEQRVAERNHMAAQKMQTEGTFGKFLTSARVTISNTVDRLTAWADDDRVVFLGATSAGLLRGAVYGGLIGILAIAAFPHIAVVGALVALGSAAVGAMVYGVHDGQSRLEEHINRGETMQPVKDSDSPAIAASGPAQQTDMQKSEIPARTDVPVQNIAPLPANGFAAREDAKRLAPSSGLQL